MDPTTSEDKLSHLTDILRLQCKKDEERILRVLNMDLSNITEPRTFLQKIIGYPVQTNCIASQYLGNNFQMNRTFEYVVDGIVLSLVSLFGLIGTILAIRVLLKPSLRTAFSTLLVGLAVCDAVFLLFAFLIIGLRNCWQW